MAPSRAFADRADAGRRLAAELPPLDNPVVLGLARGGVPVAAEVAKALDAPLDVLVVRKIGHPLQPEYALGAVSEDGVVGPPGLPEELVAPRVPEARELARSLRAGRPPVAVAGRTAVVVDDGLATGRSMAVALETVSRRDPARVVMAVPAASGPGFRHLAADYDVCAVLVVEPPAFAAVGQFYDSFDQVTDAEVMELL